MTITGSIDIQKIVQFAARSMGSSLNTYWPTDESGGCDPDEKFLSFHFAYALLSNKFAVFAEAKYPNAEDVRLDMLAISELCDCFIACEFKRHCWNSMGASLWDLERVGGFHLNTRLKADCVGQDVIESVKRCQFGIGVVAGINWDSTGRGNLSARALQPEFERQVSTRNGTIGKPELVHRYLGPNKKWTGAYYLQYAYFQTWPPSSQNGGISGSGS